MFPHPLFCSGSGPTCVNSREPPTTTMRFLLYQHPTVRSLVGPAAGSKQTPSSSGAAGSRTVVKLRRKLDRRCGDNATTTTAPTKYDRIPSPSTPTNPPTTTVVSRDSWRLDSTRRTTIPTNHNHNKKENGGKLAWGQQCSPTCACVVRFEATVDTTTGTIEQVSYHAKQLVTTPSSSSSSSSPIMVQMTRHGRPLVQDCPCHTLHALSQASLHHMIHQQQTWHGLQSSLEFRSTRSSRAFVRSVLRAQGLPVTHTHCVDVVEEALTALCKGYLPRPRVSHVETLQNSSAPTIPSPPPPSHYQYSSQDDDDDLEDDDHYHFLKFGHSWRHDPHGLPNTLFSSRGESQSTTAMHDNNTTTTAMTRDEPWLLTFLLDSMEYWNGSASASTTTATTTTTTTSPDSTTSGTMEEWHDPSHEEEYPVASSSARHSSSTSSSPSNDWIAYIDERNAQLDREAAAQEQELAVTTSSSTSSAAL